MLINYCFIASIVKSDGFKDTPHLLHLALKGLMLSLTDFRLIILLIFVPHLPQIISIDG